MDCEIILNWFRFGDMDLAVATNSEKTMNPKPLEIICFHCQQAIEKYLKGYLIFQSGEAPLKTHNLVELCALCQEYDEAFGNLKAVCAMLTMYAVQTRYPDGIELEESDMIHAVLSTIATKYFPPLAELREKLGLEDANEPNS